jgi:hypothetical protein
MFRRLLAAVAVAVLLSVPIRADEEPKLADTTERLIGDEERAARDAVYEVDIRITGTPGTDHPFQRRLVVPRDLARLFDKKPQATSRFLVRVIEVGRARDSMYAAACIEALISGPVAGALAIQEPDNWDDVIGGANRLTHREHARRVCVKLIAEKEAGSAGKDKK